MLPPKVTSSARSVMVPLLAVRVPAIASSMLPLLAVSESERALPTVMLSVAMEPPVTRRGCRTGPRCRWR